MNFKKIVRKVMKKNYEKWTATQIFFCIFAAAFFNKFTFILL